MDNKLNPNLDKFYKRKSDESIVYRHTPEGEIYKETSGTKYNQNWELTNLQLEDLNLKDYYTLDETELKT